MNGKILVVDDHSANVDLLTSMLRRDGHEVLTAPDGQKALEAIGEAHPDLVLMDVMMPTLNGFEACHRIKENPATRLTPVVLMTALDKPAASLDRAFEELRGEARCGWRRTDLVEAFIGVKTEETCRQRRS